MSFFYYISAFGIGALHAMEPGHGKSIMGAYLVLSRGRIVDAVVLGLTSAVTHTLVIAIMAAAAQFATSRVITNFPGSHRPEVWLQLLSGLLIIIVGTRLLPFQKKQSRCHHSPQRHHLPPTPGGINPRRINLLDLFLVGFTNGLIPCPSALAVLMMSLNTGQIISGLSLVLAFGIGGAVTLISTGIIFVKISSLAGGKINPRTWTGLSVACSLLIIGTGLILSCRAVHQLL